MIFYDKWTRLAFFRLQRGKDREVRNARKTESKQRRFGGVV
jgi:hypothetical protein